MNVGIVGLGLIGGSFAKAIKKNTTHKIFAFDKDISTLKFAKMIGAIDGELSSDTLPLCDFVIIALYPEATRDYIKNNARLIKKNAIVVDCCGVKRSVCDFCFEVANQSGFNFIGGHPMAGTQNSGFKHSRGTLFKNAYMILVPKQGEDIALLEKAKKLFVELGFSRITITSAARHDQIIAYTSQLAHIVSNGYVKSPNALVHKGFSAGSYKDLTRVARLNKSMWTQLLIENSDNLSSEIDSLINELEKCSAAIKAKDADSLNKLLSEGVECKEKAESMQVNSCDSF
ncbi:MAG TPA: prephenate dehydrogenase [Clostridia bacterium]|nr:prephenate dehydrogenase [Clostridia bacterium]